MTLFDAYRYRGKRVLVVGGATGMGAATADVLLAADAEVVAMDRAEISTEGVKAIHVDLADKASIDTAVDECGGPLPAPFLCAGGAGGTTGSDRYATRPGERGNVARVRFRLPRRGRRRALHATGAGLPSGLPL